MVQVNIEKQANALANGVFDNHNSSECRTLLLQQMRMVSHQSGRLHFVHVALQMGQDYDAKLCGKELGCVGVLSGGT